MRKKNDKVSGISGRHSTCGQRRGAVDTANPNVRGRHSHGARQTGPCTWDGGTAQAVAAPGAALHGGLTKKRRASSFTKPVNGMETALESALAAANWH